VGVTLIAASALIRNIILAMSAENLKKIKILCEGGGG
jgi:hypothetical protein